MMRVALAGNTKTSVNATINAQYDEEENYDAQLN